MVVQVEDFTLATIGSETEVYTEDEEKAIAKLYELIEGDEEMKHWRKFAHKRFVIIGLRTSNLDPVINYERLKEFNVHATKSYPEFFGLVDPKELKPLVEKKIFQVVKRTVDEGPAIIVVRMGEWHLSDGSIEEVAAAGALYAWAVATSSPEVQRQGLVLINDMSGFKLKHARQLSVDLVKMAVKFYGCLPPLAKAVICFHSHSIVEDTYNLFKGILPKDLKKMIHMTKNDVSVFNGLVDPARLPKEFGGSIPDEEAYVDDMEERILKEEQLFQLIQQVQEFVLGKTGAKKREKKKKEKKPKKDKNGEKIEA